MLLVTSFCLGGFLIMHVLSSSAATDAFTIPGLDKFLKNAAPVAKGQYAVFVTKANGEVGGTYTRLGRSPISAMDALQKAQAKLPASTARHAWIKLDVVTAVTNVKEDWSSRDKLPNAPDWWFGLAMDWETDWAFTPDEVNSLTLVDRHDRVRFDRLGQYASKRGLSQWFIPDDMVDDSVEYTGFEYVTTNSLFCDLSNDPKPVPLYHGHRMFPSLDPNEIMEAAILAGKHLTKNVHEDGSMLYIYYPRSGTTPEEENLTRHSGTLYAMGVLYQVWKDPELLEAIQRGLDYMMRHIFPCPLPYDQQTMGMCVHDKDKKKKHALVSKLGVNALTLLAMAQYLDATDGDTRYLETAREMAKYILGSQKDDGSFVQKVEVVPKFELDEYSFVRYYQGEATFALAKLYRVTEKFNLPSDDEWIAVAGRSADYIVAKDSRETDENWTNDHWLMYGIGELHPIQSSRTRSEHALRTARIAHEQQTPQENDIGPDRLGLFEDDLSVTSTATFSEGLCAVHDMAIDIGRVDEAQLILDTVTLAHRHQLQAQHRPETAMHFREPQRIVGGFHNTIILTDMRNDYTQHNLSSMLCLMRLLKERQV